MLFKRYSNPLDLMATYSLEGLADFILSLIDKDREEELWETWLHKDQDKSFEDFKKKYFKKLRKDKKEILSKEEEQKNIQNAMRFIKPINKGGDN